MKKGENYNKPMAGSKIAVNPIRHIKDIQAISKLLSDNPRNHLLFVMGINSRCVSVCESQMQASDHDSMC